MGVFCLPIAPNYIGPNSQGRLTLNCALSVDPSSTLTRRSVGADNLQKEHTSNTAGNRPVTQRTEHESNTRERTRYLYLFNNSPPDWTNSGVYIGAQTRI